ncbi:hypothetical protein Tco_0732011 [Tanacetum coccineum]
MHTTCRDGVAIIKRLRQDLHRDSVRDPAMTSGSGRLKEDLETSMWRRRQDFKATACFSTEIVLNAILSQFKWICDMTNPKANELYLNGMEDILDDRDSLEARKLTAEKSKE